MTVSELPPRAEVVDAVFHAVLPAAVAAGGVYALLGVFAWRVRPDRDWRRAVPAVSVFALAAAVAAGNHFRGAFPWWPDGSWWHWAGPAVGLAAVVEFSARGRWHSERVDDLFRGLAAGLVAAAVVSPDTRAERPWLVPALGLTMAVGWAVLLAVGRRGGGRLVVFGMAAVAAGASGVLMHNKTIGLSDLATVLSVGLFALGLAGAVTRADPSPAAAVAVVPVVALLALGRELSVESVPAWVFAAAGLLPLALAARLHPRAGGRLGVTAVALVVGIAAAVCVAAAMQAAPLRFGDEW